MTIHFHKYQGTGNDFVMIDDRGQSFPHDDKALIGKLCDRRFGIGSDGLILLQNAEDYDFRMVYYNADGSESTMCGNGGRCIVAFAYHLGLIGETCRFIAIDGEHEGKVYADSTISIKMSDVSSVELHNGDHVLDTGSPHYVQKVSDVNVLDVKKEGSAIRYSDSFAAEGINVNFVEVDTDSIRVATYERGVEDETYSCGTGVVACTIAMNQSKDVVSQDIITKGGQLNVKFSKKGNLYTDIWLTGPALKVFEGAIER